MGGFFSLVAIADEGMWLPQLLKAMNEEDMQAHGLQLTAEDLYSVNNSSLKDAIVSLGGFCTAEMISSEGLMLTNHHCGYDAIAENSTPENDYLTDGFWAYEYKEEKPIQGLTASIVVRIDDVSDAINSQLRNDMDAETRALKIKQNGNPDENWDSPYFSDKAKERKNPYVLDWVPGC